MHRRQAEGLQHTGPVIIAGDRLRHFCVCRPFAVQGAVTRYARSTATAASLVTHPDGARHLLSQLPNPTGMYCACASRRASRWHHCGTALRPPSARKLRVLAAANTGNYLSNTVAGARVYADRPHPALRRSHALYPRHAPVMLCRLELAARPPKHCIELRKPCHGCANIRSNKATMGAEICLGGFAWCAKSRCSLPS
jgi:hypothetical protein